MPISPPDTNTIRIFIATDNHLGHNQDDAILKDDSFITFEEILKLAKKKNADFLLLGGDLFHHNRPRRDIIHRAIELFRTYCCGDEPVSLQIHSNQKDNFHTKFATVNYEDPNFNIALPVFAIHGNHDDPGSDQLSAMDILADTNMINYFGKNDNLNDVNVKPILLSKGDAKLALYGLGYLRDERLYRLMKDKKVTFYRPKDDGEDWFNLFVIHQNRHREEIGRKNVVTEGMLRGFFDMVVWGHEHEQLVNPEYSEHGAFQVIQPGSSIPVSLIPQEAKEKKVCIVDIKPGGEFEHYPLTLKTVRPFIYDQIFLDDELDNSIDKTDPEEITNFLEEKVNAMIEKAQQRMPPKKILDKYPTLNRPLIRLRVEHTDAVSTVNPLKFGQRFVERVANPKDLLKFSRKKTVRPKSTTNATDREKMEDIEDNLATTSIEEVLSKFMEQQETAMKLIPRSEIQDAIYDFVEKQESKSIETYVKKRTKSIQKKLTEELAKLDGDITDDVIDSILTKFMDEEEEKERTGQRKNERIEKLIEQTGDDEEETEETKPSTRKRARAATPESDFDDEPAPKRARKTSTRAKKSTRGRKRKADNIKTEESDDEEEKTPPSKKRKVSKSTKSSTQKKKKSPQKLVSLLSDSDEEEAPPSSKKKVTSRWGKRS